ncbi:hypothetical protein PAECIP111894_02139 [Paenibacillus pseudetheri]|uniref:Uncharacterized protein n=1 Tax=Paenibacillus pseudetheri TaxID=2897682 RepID=A0ABM9BCP8_9BACL|nr:hypothetical protein PAECIP111894_02139 [Paenibacillus pseudetheri]
MLSYRTTKAVVSIPNHSSFTKKYVDFFSEELILSYFFGG